MKLRGLAAAAACMSTLGLAQLAPSYADGMPEPEEGNFNPVPSVPGVPAPGVTQPAPIHDTKPSPVATPKPNVTTPVTKPAPVSQPAPATKPAPVVSPSTTPAPAPVVAPAPVSTPAPTATKPAAPTPAAPASPAVVPPPAQPTPPAATKPAMSPASPAPVAAVGAQETVKAVEGVEVTYDKKTDTATVVVTGRTETGGWTNFDLRPTETFSAEGKYMRSYTLVGTRPTGFSTQVETPITASVKLTQLPPEVKTIRVLSRTTEMAHTFPRD